MDTGDHPDPAGVLQLIAPLSYLRTDILNELASKIEFQFFPRCTYVYHQGEPSRRTLFLIAAGMAEVIINDNKYNKSTLGLRRQYEFFGESVLSGGVYPVSVKVLEDMYCYFLPKDLLEKLMLMHPDFCKFFSQNMAERICILYEEIMAGQSHYSRSSADSTLYRKRVAEIMSTPVITCTPETSIATAARLMESNNISALIVLDEQKHPNWLLTERDMLTKIIAGNLDNSSPIPVSKIMNSNLIQLPPDAYFSQALLAITRNRVKQLAVVDKDQVVGIVTITDLLKTRVTGTLMLTHDIETRQSIDDLCSKSREIDKILVGLLEDNAPVPDILEIMAEFHDRLNLRVIQLTEEEMVQEGYGAPPCTYCWINMGSAGRREQTLRTDQDNAIIYNDPPPGQEENYHHYFKLLGEKVVRSLTTSGFVICNGDVIASNTQWCRSLTGWKLAIDEWINTRQSGNVRMLSILLDFRPVYGDLSLTNSLWETVFTTLQQSATISHLLIQDDMRFKVPLSILGKFLTEKSGANKHQINLKTSSSLHIVNCIRIFAISNGIKETSTFGRLRELVRLKIIEPDDAELIQSAYETLLLLRIRENLNKLKKGLPADNYVNPYLLSKREQSLLKEAFLAVNRLQKITSNAYNIFWLNYLTS